MKIAISGAGVAGPSLAYWLLRTGHEPTLIEQAPRLRTGGYMIDFWGVGYTVAERMGILPAIREAGYAVDEVRIVDSHGRRAGGFPPAFFGTCWTAASPACRAEIWPPKSIAPPRDASKRCSATAFPELKNMAEACGSLSTRVPDATSTW